jgi:hypothetical protein
VYLDEGIDSFDGPLNPEDNRTVFDNDMHISLTKKGAEGQEEATLDDMQRLRIGKGDRDTIEICVTRFDGRDNVGHVRSETFKFSPSGKEAGVSTKSLMNFSVKNLLKFMFKTDQFEVYYQDWFPHYVRRIIISENEKTNFVE